MGEAIFWVQVTVQITQLPGGADNAIAQASMLALGGKAEQAEALLLDKAQPEDAVAMYLAAGEHLAAIRCKPLSLLVRCSGSQGRLVAAFR